MTDSSHDVILKALEESNNRLDEPYHMARSKVIQDYLKVLGRTIKVRHVLIWPTDKHPGPDGREDFRFDNKPISVRVTGCCLDDLSRVCDKFLDPEWNAEIIEAHPDLDPTEWDLSSVEVFGNSYNIETGEFNNNDSGWEISEEV